MQLGSSAPLLYVHSEQTHSDGALPSSMLWYPFLHGLLSAPRPALSCGLEKDVRRWRERVSCCSICLRLKLKAVLSETFNMIPLQILRGNSRERSLAVS